MFWLNLYFGRKIPKKFCFAKFLKNKHNEMKMKMDWLSITRPRLQVLTFSKIRFNQGKEKINTYYSTRAFRTKTTYKVSQDTYQDSTIHLLYVLGKEVFINLLESWVQCHSEGHFVTT